MAWKNPGTGGEGWKERGVMETKSDLETARGYELTETATLSFPTSQENKDLQG